MTDKFDNMPLLTPHALGFEKPQKLIDISLSEDAPEPEPEPIPEDPFIDEIAKIKTSQSPAVRNAIEGNACFGRYWFVEPGLSKEISGICTELGCDLRSLCELTFQRATGKTPAKPLEEPCISLTKSQEVPKLSQEKRKVGRPRKPPRISSSSWIRAPYINKNRPSDALAEEIWKLMGGPPALPDTWAYPPCTNKDDRSVAAKQFTDRYGPGVVCSKRQQYHQYFRDGIHFIRVWLLWHQGVWVDLAPETAKVAKKLSHISLQLPPTKLMKTRYKFYPFRSYVKTKNDLKHWARLFNEFGIAPLS